MNKYKEDWNAIEGNIKWKFQNNELEDIYEAFVKERYETDFDLHKDTIDWQNQIINLSKEQHSKTGDKTAIIFP